MREYIGGNDKANEIRMLLSHPSYKNKVIMVVEGGTDIRLFRKFFSHEMLEFVDVDGKSQVLHVMSDLIEIYAKRLLAICDADFDNLTEIENDDLGVFLTDYHDAEIMMIQSSAFAAFAQEYSMDNWVYRSDEILENCLAVAYTVGLLRWMSVENNLKLNFKAINLHSFLNIDDECIEIDTSCLISTLLQRSANAPRVTTANLIAEKLEEYKVRNCCKLQVCCGHDATKIVSCVYQQPSVSLETNMNQRKVESSLRIGYGKSEFESSVLFRRVNSFLSSVGVNLESSGAMI